MKLKLGQFLTVVAFVMTPASVPVHATADSGSLPLPYLSFTEMRLNIFADDVRTNHVYLGLTEGGLKGITIELTKECTLKVTASRPDGKLHMGASADLKAQTITGGICLAVEIEGERCFEVIAEQMTLDRIPKTLVK